MKLLRLICVLGISVLSAASAHASTILYGTEFTFQHEFNGRTYDQKTFEVQSGTDVRGLEGLISGGAYTIDIEGDTLSFAMGPYNFNTNFGFNGFVITDLLDNAPSFLGLELVSDTFAGTPTFSVTENELRFDFGDAGQSANATAEFKIEIAAVPLPSSMGFLAVALGGLALAKRRKTRA